jgi:YidC/Oxa1 family membrane protein insertase
MTKELAVSFANAELFGSAPLQAAMYQVFDGSNLYFGTQAVSIVLIAAVMVILMSGSQFITQLQIMSKNQSPEMKASPMYRQQRILLYVLPLVFLFSGVFFPLGVMFYWLVSNFWTMGQQFIVIRNMPTPGTEAAKQRDERLAKKRAKKGLPDPEEEQKAIEAEPPAQPKQRPQPVSKDRSKKKKKKKGKGKR